MLDFFYSISKQGTKVLFFFVFFFFWGGGGGGVRGRRGQRKSLTNWYKQRT